MGRELRTIRPNVPRESGSSRSPSTCAVSRRARTTSPRTRCGPCRATPGDFDIVITDLTMPKMRGDALAEAIHAIRPDVPVLLTTGYSPRRAKAWRSCGGQVLPNPFSMQEVATAIRRCLGSPGRAA